MSMKKIIILFVICCASQLGLSGADLSVYGAVGVANQRFGDLKASHWAFQPVTELAERGIISGYPDKTFQPEKFVTYGEFIKMASMILDGRDPGNSPGKVWAMYYYEKLKERGVYTEFDIPDVKLNWQIPRGDMALIVSGLLPEASVPDFDKASRAINDVTPDTDNQYEIVKAYSLGILKGYPDGTFLPEETLTRGEAAACLERSIAKRGETSIYGLFSNMEEYRKEDWIETDQYKFITPEDANMTLRVPWTGRVAGFDHTMVGFIYLVKGHKIIEYCLSIPAETFITTASHVKLNEFDYIMSIPSKHGTQTHILVVKNPFGGEGSTNETE